jgi:hypothetical protein
MERLLGVHVAEGASELVGDALALQRARQAIGAHCLVQVQRHVRAEQVQVRAEGGDVACGERQQVGVTDGALVGDLAEDTLSILRV